MIVLDIKRDPKVMDIFYIFTKSNGCSAVALQDSFVM